MPTSLQLIPFLSVLPSPTCVLNATPLSAQLASSEPHSLHAIKLEWCNDAWEEMTRATNLGAEASGHVDSSTPANRALDESRLSFLSVACRKQLLEFLIVLLDDGNHSDSLSHSQIQLGLISIHAALLPARTHFVLTATPLPQLTTTGTALEAKLSHSVARHAPPPLFDQPLSVDPYREALRTTILGRLIDAYPWHTTSLGDIDTWVPELKVLISVMLASPFREAVLWGEDQIMLYNDAYINAAMGKHPFLLGKPLRTGWSELWSGLAPLVGKVMAGETLSVTDHLLVMDRTGNDSAIREETYFTFAYTPFRGGPEAKVLGFSSVSFETTASVIAARRLVTVRDLNQSTLLCKTVVDFCQVALESLENNPYDLPFCMLYTTQAVTLKPSPRELSRLASNSNSEKTALTKTSIKLTCRGSIGVPEGHPFAASEVLVDISPLAQRLSISSSISSASVEQHNTPSWHWPFEDACMRREPTLVDNLEDFAHRLEPRGWPDDPPRQACVIPVFSEPGQLVPVAVVVVGLNSRGILDSLYQTFLQLVSRQIGIGILSVSNAEADSKRAADLIALDRAKTNFFSNVSHELRTPLTLVLGPLEDVLASKDQLSTESREKLMTVQRHSNRLLTMVNKLLDFSSLEGGRMQYKFRPVKFGTITRDLANLFRDAIERGKIVYTVNCDDQDPPHSLPIYLATELWEKVMFNLIGNSFKYCLKGSIEITVRSTRAEAVLSVRDTGVGIAADELGLIFERFHRVESTSRTTTGTGIGLALTLEIVKVLGGQLEVQSTVGEGSTFSVRFPRGFTHLPRDQVSHEPAELEAVPPPTHRNFSVIEEALSWRHDNMPDRDIVPHTSSASSSSGSVGNDDYLTSAELLNLKNCTVLLADDSKDIRSYVTSILSKSFNIVQVPDGQAALEYALKNPPSLVVTDVMMPRLDGRGLLAALRSDPITDKIPVIFLSAQAGAEARAEALEAGADDYLCKPFQARELLARCNVHLQLGRMRKELERRVAERTTALIASEARYRELADRYSTLSVLSPVGVFLTDTKGNLSYANPRWYEISGHPLEKPLSDWQGCILPEDLERATAAWNAAVDGSMVEDYEFRFKQGNWVQFELRSFHDVGSSDGFVGAITDISRIKRSEALHLHTVEQRASDAEETRKQQEQFIDMASHELRNPLSGVWQNADLLASSLEHMISFLDTVYPGMVPLPGIVESLKSEMEENREAVQSIIHCSRHQARIADDILNVSKLNMGLLSINLVAFDLVSKISEVVRIFRVECNQKSIQLVVDIDPSLQALNARWILADSGRIAQVLINFISNSIKYTTDAPERRITIHVSCYSGPPPRKPHALRVSEPQVKGLPEGSVWIVVGCQDSGKGLTGEQLGRLFARFIQANPRSDQYGGNGLGLYVCKKLVELHDGFIEVESVPNEGSTFRFAFPAGRAPESTPMRSHSAPSSTYRNGSKRSHSADDFSSGDAQVSVKSARMDSGAAGCHVLVVEDNIINQTVMSRQLKLEQFTVQLANNGQEALEILAADRERRINIVLMDIEMPVMDGLTAIRELRRLEAGGTARYNVIAVTGNARQGQIDECLSSGFDDVTLKPYRVPELLAQISRLVFRRTTAGHA